MDLQNVAAPRSIMQSIHVLRDERKLPGALLDLRESAVAGVRLDTNGLPAVFPEEVQQTTQAASYVLMRSTSGGAGAGWRIRARSCFRRDCIMRSCAPLRQVFSHLSGRGASPASCLPSGALHTPARATALIRIVRRAAVLYALAAVYCRVYQPRYSPLTMARHHGSLSTYHCTVAARPERSGLVAVKPSLAILLPSTA